MICIPSKRRLSSPPLVTGWCFGSSDIAGRIDPRVSFCRLVSFTKKNLCLSCHCHTLLPFTCAHDFLSGHRHLLRNVMHIHEQMTTSNYGYDIAYNFTHNNIMLEHNAMNNMNTVAHMDVHNTQY